MNMDELLRDIEIRFSDANIEMTMGITWTQSKSKCNPVFDTSDIEFISEESSRKRIQPTETQSSRKKSRPDEELILEIDTDVQKIRNTHETELCETISTSLETMVEEKIVQQTKLFERDLRRYLYTKYKLTSK